MRIKPAQSQVPLKTPPGPILRTLDVSVTNGVMVDVIAVPRELFAAILDQIQRFGVPPPLIQRS